MPKGPHDHLDRLFAALADATRRDVLMRLAAGEAAAVSDLARGHAMALPSFTQHLRVLEEAGLIQSDRSKHRRKLELNAEGLQPLVSWLAGYCIRVGGPLSAQSQAPGASEASTVREGTTSQLGRARTLILEVAPVMAVFERGLAAPPTLQEEPADGLSPQALAAGYLGLLLERLPDLRPQLTAGLASYHQLLILAAAVDQGAPVDDLKPAALALSRMLYAWRSQPALRRVIDMVPRAA
ncbi:MAG: regulatory protein arsr [Cyanobacteria bacterium RYN_339]|nr:regulatory protein arsr [Cyanobacteria bacterium RYN_339]